MDWARAIPGIVILILVVARLAASTQPLGPVARQMALIVAFGAVLVVGYSYRDDFHSLTDRLTGSIVPSRGVEVAPGTIRFTANDNAQFAIDAVVNGTAVHFLMDTGASGIVFSKHDAERLGFDLRQLTYSAEFSTANGLVRAAPITLNSLQIGPLEATDVSAWVNEGDLDGSLLGMSYLSTLGRIEIRGDTLILERAR
jgi:aspartyl protease family protein